MAPPPTPRPTFHLRGRPRPVTALAPTAGHHAGGTTVTITGTDLAGATAVDLRWHRRHRPDRGHTTPPSRSLTPPAGRGGRCGRHHPRWRLGHSAAGDFTYVDAPTVTSSTPTTGPSAGGTTVTITGTDLAGPPRSTFGGTAPPTGSWQHRHLDHRHHPGAGRGGRGGRHHPRRHSATGRRRLHLRAPRSGHHLVTPTTGPRRVAPP